MIILNILVYALGLDLLQHGLEFPDEKHVFVNAQKCFGTIGLKLLFSSPSIFVEWDIRTNKFASLALLLRFDYLRFWHDSV